MITRNLKQLAGLFGLGVQRQSLTAAHSKNILQGLIRRQFATELASKWPDEIKSFLDKEKILEPTAIQEKTFKAALNDKDLVGVARTGSGKTLAFVIPAIMKILESRKASSDQLSELPSCLVLEPTRELANQTADVFRKFRGSGIRSIVLVGGGSRSAQVSALALGTFDVYIATPGRLMDLMETNTVDLSNIKYFVLDEADRMLDMGFEPQVRKIIASIPKDRQTMMWSATWPKEVELLAADFLRDYDYISVDSEKLKANPNISQTIELCQPHLKFDILVNNMNHIKQEFGKARILIFVNTKRRADQLLVQLMRNRFRAVVMHGDKTQNQRERALKLFKDKQCDILVATDVAARGLDISDITHVVNYDMPTCIEDYIHRIGRTARYEKKGFSISFFTESDAALARKLIRVLEETGQPVPPRLQNLSRMRQK